MSRIDQMIKELCPEGVENKKIGAICEIKTGKGITKTDASADGIYPIISGGIEPMGFYKEFNREANTVTVSRVGANAGTVLFNTKRFYLNDKCFSVIPIKEYSINTKFLYYYLHYIENVIKDLQSEGGVPTINTQKLGNIQIPLPPLSIQKEIVSVLDSFTTLIDKMKQEVEKRKKQMEYYREKLLTFEDGECEWKTLGEVAQIKNGKDYKHLSFGDIPVWGTGGIMTYVDKYAYDKPSVLLPRKGSINNVYYTENPFWTVDTLFYTEINNAIVKERYLYVYMSNVDLSKYNTSVGNRPSLTKTVLDDIPVPVPSLDKQSSIVSTLDKFESYISKLEKMIALRQKQYEYYREQLLTFE